MEMAWRAVIFCLAVLLFAAAVLPVASAPKSPKIIVEAAWSRTTPPTAKVGAVYLTVRNTGSKSDRLFDGQTPVAARVEIHEMGTRDGAGFMRKIDVLDIPASGTVTFEPGALHLMLIGLTGRLVEGQTYPLDLHFEKAGIVKADVTVKGFAARSHKTGPFSKTHAEHSQREHRRSHVYSK